MYCILLQVQYRSNCRLLLNEVLKQYPCLWYCVKHSQYAMHVKVRESGDRPAERFKNEFERNFKYLKCWDWLYKHTQKCVMVHSDCNNKKSKNYTSSLFLISVWCMAQAKPKIDNFCMVLWPPLTHNPHYKWATFYTGLSLLDWLCYLRISKPTQWLGTPIPGSMCAWLYIS